MPLPHLTRKSAANADEGATSIAPLKLQEAILVGNYQNQIKFSELTLDMYRMLQSLEREPNSTQLPAASDPASMVKRSNPHKYLLYRPTIAQLLLYIATAHKVCEVVLFSMWLLTRFLSLSPLRPHCTFLHDQCRIGFD